MLSKRVQSIKTSPSIKMTLLAMQLKAESHDVISLSVGEPDFDTPEPIKNAGISAINHNKTRYTAVAGNNTLLDSIIVKLKRDNQLDYQHDEILVSAGAKHSIINAMLALLDKGDEVIIPSPYWVSYPDMTRLADATPIIVETKAINGYKLTAYQLRQHVNDKTKILIINSPNNPSGAVYSAQELKALADVLLDFPKVIVISDDIYEHIQWTGQRFHNIASVAPELKPRTLVINGLSKSHAMTGWRIGFCAGNATIIKAMVKLQGQMSGNVCSISQEAATEAFQLDKKYITPFVEKYKNRHDKVCQRLNQMDGISCQPAEGAFYLFANIKTAIHRLSALNKGVEDDLSFCLKLLEEQYVSTVPGSAFGMPGYIRISYALDDVSLMEALDRIEAFVSA